jgi:hypothetical protein
VCAKLICEKCGFCAQNCQYCSLRQAGWPIPSKVYWEQAPR